MHFSTAHNETPGKREYLTTKVVSSEKRGQPAESFDYIYILKEKSKKKV